MKKRIIASVTILITLLLMVVPIFATNTVLSFDTSPVLDDLVGAKIEDKQFNINDYPAKVDGDLCVLAVLEYGYYLKDNSELAIYDGSLYIYIYNPKKIAFDVNSEKNKITIGNNNTFDKYSNPVNYFKYDLQYISKTSDNLFYKFKIIGYTFDDYRKYTVSEIELYNSGSNATSYKVGKTWKYSGYDEGYHAQSATQSTKVCMVGEIETIELTLKSTTFRTPNSAKGEYYQQDLHTVWFTVPKSYLNNYGSLVAIEAEWYEYNTNPIIVTSSLSVLNAINPMKGVEFSSNYNANYPVVSPDPYNVVSLETHIVTYKRYSINSLQNTSTFTSYAERYYKYVADTIYVDSINHTVSKEELKYNLDNNVSYFLSNTADNGRKAGYNHVKITTDDTFDLKSFTASLTWYQKIFNNSLIGYGNGIDDVIIPILLMDGNISRNMTANYIGADEQHALYLDYMKALATDSVVILFRFAVTDYYAEYVDVYNPSVTTAQNKDTYVAIMSVFKDFDVISLTFGNDYGETVIPVAASPINIIPDITPPLEKKLFPDLDTDSMFDMIKRILQLLLVILIIVIFWKPLMVVIKFIIGIIKTPFDYKRRRK